MKLLLKQQTSPDISNNVSTGDDPEISSNAMSIDADILTKNSIFRFFPQHMDLNPARMILAELVGTFILMFCVCGIIASTELTRGAVGLMEYASTAGLTIVVLIYSIGAISGAHVNPAVTIAFASFGHFPWSRVPFYILAQTIGSTAATYVGRSVYGIKPELITTRPLQSCISAFWVELIATFIIMFLAAALTYQAQFVGRLSGFIAGVSIGLAVLITGPISGGSMNPARSLGPAIVSWNFKDLWVYITAPVIGALAGALTYQVLRIKARPCSAISSPGTRLLAHSIAFGGT